MTELSLSSPIRVFLVDDHEVVREGLRSMLEAVSSIAVVGSAASAAEALSRLKTLAADVVLTDLRMSGTGGHELLLRIREDFPHLRCAVLTSYGSEEDIYMALEANARAYLLKSSTLSQIVAALHRVHAGETSIPADVAERLARRVGRAAISRREREVLQLVAKGRNNKEIGQTLFISSHTVRNHVISLLAKLQCRDRTEATAAAIRQGLVKVDPE